MTKPTANPPSTSQLLTALEALEREAAELRVYLRGIEPARSYRVEFTSRAPTDDLEAVVAPLTAARRFMRALRRDLAGADALAGRAPPMRFARVRASLVDPAYHPPSPGTELHLAVVVDTIADDETDGWRGRIWSCYGDHGGDPTEGVVRWVSDVRSERRGAFDDACAEGLARYGFDFARNEAGAP